MTKLMGIEGFVKRELIGLTSSEKECWAPWKMGVREDSRKAFESAILAVYLRWTVLKSMRG